MWRSRNRLIISYKAKLNQRNWTSVASMCSSLLLLPECCLNNWLPVGNLAHWGNPHCCMAAATIIGVPGGFLGFFWPRVLQGPPAVKVRELFLFPWVSSANYNKGLRCREYLVIATGPRHVIPRPALPRPASFSRTPLVINQLSGAPLVAFTGRIFSSVSWLKRVPSVFVRG